MDVHEQSEKDMASLLCIHFMHWAERIIISRQFIYDSNKNHTVILNLHRT
jgi:hypothetical protein